MPDHRVVRLRGVSKRWLWSCECGATGGHTESWWTNFLSGHLHLVVSKEHEQHGVCTCPSCKRERERTRVSLMSEGGS